MTSAPGAGGPAGVESSGGRPTTACLGPLTSTPREAHPPAPLPSPDLPEESCSSLPSSSSSESSEEDWLIKICCPGARHRFRRFAEARKNRKSRLSSDVHQEDDFTKLPERLCFTPYQSYPGLVPRKESTDLEWLLRVRCPRAQMEEEKTAAPKQPLPEVSTSLSKSGSKTSKSSQQSEKTQDSGGLLSKKRLSIVQGVINATQDTVDSTQSLLDRENCYVREVDRYLKHNDFLALRRREMLYKKWFENVQSPLLQKIQDKVDNQSSEEIEERKRKQLSLYLAHCNKKGSVCLDNYNPSVYDPFLLKTRTDLWKVSVPPFCDPLLKEIQGRYLEAGIIRQCETGQMYSFKEICELHKAELPPFPLSRQFMSPIEWLKIPSGYMESEIRQKSRRKMSTTRNRSSEDFKGWSEPSSLLPNKGCLPTRKPDSFQMPNLVPKQIRPCASPWKSAIKSAS